jgi:hypothetical protein
MMLTARVLIVRIMMSLPKCQCQMNVVTHANTLLVLNTIENTLSWRVKVNVNKGRRVQQAQEIICNSQLSWSMISKGCGQWIESVIQIVAGDQTVKNAFQSIAGVRNMQLKLSTLSLSIPTSGKNRQNRVFDCLAGSKKSVKECQKFWNVSERRSKLSK